MQSHLELTNISVRALEILTRSYFDFFLLWYKFPSHASTNISIKPDVIHTDGVDIISDYLIVSSLSTTGFICSIFSPLSTILTVPP